MRLPLFCIAVCVLALAGCARVSTTTTISADGSYARKIAFKVSKSGSGMGAALTTMGGDAKDPNAKPPKEKPEDYFKIPAGTGFKIERSEDKNDLVVTASRDALAGAAAVQDIALWAEKGKVLATSSVVVNKLPDGRLEYIETLHGNQPKKDQPFALDELRPRVKKVIPQAYQTTEIIDKITKEVAVNYVHAIFGPPEPMLFSVLTSPDATLRRVNAFAFTENIRSFREIVPGLTEGQAQEMARALAESMAEAITNQTDMMSDPSKSEGKSSDNEMTTLSFAVKFPGRIVETNGLFDPVTGEVYWSLIPAGLEVGDAKLRLVIQP